MKYLYFFVGCVHICLVLAKSPKLIELPKQSEANQNSSYAIVCTLSTGTKPVYFEWLQDDHKIVPSNDVQIKNSESSSLLIFSHLRSTNSATFSCMVKNVFGHDLTSTRLIVKGLQVVENFLNMCRSNWVGRNLKCRLALMFCILPFALCVLPKPDHHHQDEFVVVVVFDFSSPSFVCFGKASQDFGTSQTNGTIAEDYPCRSLQPGGGHEARVLRVVQG